MYKCCLRSQQYRYRVSFLSCMSLHSPTWPLLHIFIYSCVLRNGSRHVPCLYVVKWFTRKWTTTHFALCSPGKLFGVCMFRSGNVIFPQGLSFDCTNTLCHIKIQLHSQEEGTLINANAWVWFHFKPWLRPNSYEPRSKEYVSLLEPGQRPQLLLATLERIRFTFRARAAP